jgi:predicted secreted protein
VHSFEISASGISKTSNKASVQAVMDDFLTGVATNYQTVIPIFGTFQGALVVTAFNITAQHDGAIEFDLTIQSNGAPAFTPEP